MSDKRTIVIITVVAVLAIGATGWHFYKTGQKESRPTDIVGERPIDSPSVAVKADGTGQYVLEEVPLLEVGGPDDNIPALRRPIVFSAAFSEEAQAIMRQKIAVSIAALEKDSRVFDEWVNLAILRQTVNDYEGARQIWEFLIAISPAQPGPYANLAALYAFELKDPARAEKNFVQALKLWPKEVSVWRNAYDFYRYVQKDDEKTKQLLKDGIVATRSPDLQYLLEHYSEL